MSKTIILKHTEIANKIRRIAYQIYEMNANEKEIIIAGIENNGFILAQRISKILTTISGIKVKIYSLQVAKKTPLQPIISTLTASDYKNKSVVIVDDVLNSGTTLIYAVKFFLEEPLKQLKTVVLVDRNHKKYPIKVDFKGISLSTSLQDRVEVIFSEKEDYAYIE